MKSSTTLSFKPISSDKPIANKQRTNLLLLVDKELRGRQETVLINSMTEKQIKDKNSQNFVVEINENFNQNCLNTSQNSTNTSIFYIKEKSRKTQNEDPLLASLNTSCLSNISVKSSVSSNNIASINTNLLSKSSSSFSPFEIFNKKNLNWNKKDKNFLKTAKVLEQDLIFESFKMLKNLAENIKNKKPKTSLKIIERNPINLKSKLIQTGISIKTHKVFQIKLQSMHSGEEIGSKRIKFGKSLDFSFEDV
jgi:hypothetical protein